MAGTSNCPIAEFDKSDPNCSSNFADIWIIAFDDSLNIIWNKTYGGNKNENIFNIDSYNNHILISGNSNSDSSCTLQSSNKGGDDYLILTIDTLGNITKEFRLGSSGSDINCKAKPTLDGGIMIMGASNGPSDGDKTDSNLGNYDYWIIKLDSLGNKMWDKVLGGNSVELNTSIDNFNFTLLNDSGFLYYGSTSSINSGNVTGSSFGLADAWVVKTNKNGQILWDRRYGGINFETISDLIESNNSYYLLGFTSSPSGGTIQNPGFGGGYNDFWLMKTDTSGNIEWETKYGTTNDEHAIKILKNNQGNMTVLGIVTTTGNGSFGSPSFGQTDYLVMNLDSTGNLLNYIILGSDSLDFPNNLIVLNDSTFLVCGSAGHGTTAVKHDIGKGGSDYWVVKIGYSTTTGITDIGQNLQLHLQPNPAHDYVEIMGLPSDDYEVNIYSIEGRLLASKKQHADLSLTIPVSHFQSGMYLTEIRNDKLKTTVKWVKE
jgi:hypothetical protein